MLRVLTFLLTISLGHTMVSAQDCDPGILGRPVICEGGSATLSIDEDCWEYWEWNTGTRAPSITVFAPGRYFVEGVDRDGVHRTVEVDVVVVPLPRPLIGNPLEYICEGDVAVLQARDDYRSYRWSTGDSTNTLIISRAGTYWLEVVDTNGCVGRSDEVQIIIVDRPDLEITGPLDVCRDQELVYTTPMVDGASYTWSIDGGTIISGSTTNSIRVSWQRSGSLQVRAVVQRPDGGTCDSTASIFVQAKSRVRPTLAYDRSSFCTGDSITLSLEGDYPAWTWNTGSNARTITVKQGGPYWIEVVDTNGCPGITDTLTVREYPQPMISIRGETALCGSDPIVLRAVAEDDDVVLWRWSTNASTASIAVDQPGVYQVVGWTLNGCSDTAEVVVTVAEPLAVTASSVDYGVVDVGVPHQGVVFVRNLGPQEVTVSRVISIVPELTVTPPAPFTIQPGGTFALTVVWTPTGVGSLETFLVFELNSTDCSDTAMAAIRGQTRNDTTGTVTIAIADTVIDAGRELALPLVLDVDNPSPVDVRVHIYISAIRDVFDMRYWDLEGSVFGIPTITGDRVELDVLWELEPGRSQGTINIVGVAMLGRPFRTDVVIDSVVVDGGIPFGVDTKDGSVTIRGCWLPGRLIAVTDAVFKRRYFTVDGREVFDKQQCRPCLEVLQDMNGMIIATYLTNNISR